MSKKNKEYDQNIIAALKALPKPLKTFDGHDVLLDSDKRDETIFEHIADKKHHLHVADIEVIPNILSKKESLYKDRSGKKYRSYIGRRGRQKERVKYLKIVTEIRKGNKESIITIYLTKNRS